VLEGLRGEDSIAELCRKEGINQNLYYRWSKEFLEAGKKRLAGEGFELVRVFVEVETGKGADALDRRPQLATGLSEARRQRCPVAVAKLDRLSRDVHFISGLMAHRVPF
jgi:transposase-like protein